MKTRFFLSLLALFFAGGILVTSLAAASQVSSSGEKPSTDRELYFDREILPDNMLYPVRMAVDRIHLETASTDERVFMELEFANRRLGYGEELLSLHKENLAVTTITKAEQYLFHAVQDAMDNQAPESVRLRLAKAVRYHVKRIQEMSSQFNDANRATLDRVVQEDTALLPRLEKSAN
jgi:hypothetical protein